jgi:hypothetical protein
MILNVCAHHHVRRHHPLSFSTRAREGRGSLAHKARLGKASFNRLVFVLDAVA